MDLHGMHTFYQLPLNSLHASAVQSLWLRNQTDSNDVEQDNSLNKQKPGTDETANQHIQII